MATSNSSEDNTSTGKQSINDFNATLISAIVVLALVALGMIVYLWFFPNTEILFVQPLSISLKADCIRPEEARCYELTAIVQEGQSYLSVIAVVKICVTLVTFTITLLNYNYNPFKATDDNRFSMLSNKILISVALALFAWISFSAIEVLAGLAAFTDADYLLEMSRSVAVLTIAVFVSVISFLLIEWVRDIDVVDIGRSGIVILIVSYSLSIPLASHDWNVAYSVLGDENSSAMISGGNGTQMLFTLTMIALGLVFMAFAINVAYIYHSIFKDKFHTLKFLAGFLGFLAGLGSIIVGVFPTNTMPIPHAIGAYGAVASSIALIFLLLYMYPKDEIESASFKQLRLMIVGVLGSSVVVIFLLKLATNDLTFGLLEQEFAYFFLFLLFIQVYSSFLIEYIALHPNLPTHKDYQAQRSYLVPEKLVKAVIK